LAVDLVCLGFACSLDSLGFSLVWLLAWRDIWLRLASLLARLGLLLAFLLGLD
jgi:hypothetical protein